MQVPLNRLTLCGRVATLPEWNHEMFGEDFYQCSIAVGRLSGALDVLPMTFSGRLCDPAALSGGQPIRLRGQVRAYKKLIDGKNRLLVVAFAQHLSMGEAGDEPANSVELCGKLLKPPIHRMTPLGREIADLLIGIPRTASKTDSLPCIAWGRNARYARTLDEGCFVRCGGRLQSRPYQKRYEDGRVEEKTALEISLSSIYVPTVSDAD